MSQITEGLQDRLGHPDIVKSTHGSQPGSGLECTDLAAQGVQGQPECGPVGGPPPSC